MSHHIIHIESSEAFEKILASAGTQLVIADFYANWYPPCIRFTPVFEAMA